ncbi:MAG: hypothetical protein ACLVHE_04560 [Dialister invisus]
MRLNYYEEFSAKASWEPPNYDSSSIQSLRFSSPQECHAFRQPPHANLKYFSAARFQATGSELKTKQNSLAGTFISARSATSLTIFTSLPPISDFHSQILQLYSAYCASKMHAFLGYCRPFQHIIYSATPNTICSAHAALMLGSSSAAFNSVSVQFVPQALRLP